MRQRAAVKRAFGFDKGFPGQFPGIGPSFVLPQTFPMSKRFKAIWKRQSTEFPDITALFVSVWACGP
jgi:hypothetical protein